MPSVVVAASVRKALRRITAKDHRILDIPRLVKPILIPESLPIPSGKFWDSGSESGCEDLGDADTLAGAQTVRLPVPPPAPAFHAKKIQKPGLIPRRIQVPWGRSWKGPLPPRRSTSAVTFGDFFVPALEAVRSGTGHNGGLGNAQGDDQDTVHKGCGAGGVHAVNQDSALVGDQDGTIPKKGFRPLKICVGPRSSREFQPRGSPDRTQPPTNQGGPDRALYRPKRRVVNLSAFSDCPTTYLPPPPTFKPKPPYSSPSRSPPPTSSNPPCSSCPQTYLEALMAGRGRWNRGRSSGRGAPNGGRGNQGGPSSTGTQATSGTDAALQGHQAGSGQRLPGRGRAQQARGGQHMAPSTATANQPGNGGLLPENAGSGGTANTQAPAPQDGGGQRQAGRRGRQPETIEASQDPTPDGDDDQGRQKSVKKECSICLGEHFTNFCPLLQGPKPTVTYCGAAEDEGGFFHIQAARPGSIVTSTQFPVAALISVETGELSARLLKTELSRIIPVDWEWEVQELGPKSFVVPFPSKEELDRMVAIHTITTRNKEATFEIDEFVDDVQPIKILDQFWFTVSRVPRVLRSFLQLWAVGTIIGSTQKVDMVHLRATGEARILVAVFDSKKIPKVADVCVGRNIYRLHFKCEEPVQEMPFNPEEDDLLGDNDKDLGGDEQMEDADGAGSKLPEKNSNTYNDSSVNSEASAQNMISQQQASLISDSLDLACNQLLEEISIKVMVENDEGALEKCYSPLTVEELDTYNATVGSLLAIHPSTFPSLAYQVDGLESGRGSASAAPSAQPLSMLSGDGEAESAVFNGAALSPAPSADSPLPANAAPPSPSQRDKGGATPAAAEKEEAPPVPHAAAFAEMEGAQSVASPATPAPASPAAANAEKEGTSAATPEKGAPSAASSDAVGKEGAAPASPAATSAVKEGAPHAESPDAADATAPAAVDAMATAPAAPKPLRRSSRSAALADEHTLLKAERLTAKRNLESPEIDRLTLSANNKKKLSTVHSCNLESDDESEARLEDVLSRTCDFYRETLDLYSLNFGIITLIPKIQDDTIIFIDHDPDQAKNLKLLLCAFEQLSGLKINFHKSEIFCYGEAKEMENFYTTLFGCNAREFPFRYLGIPMHHRQLLNSDWRKVIFRGAYWLRFWAQLQRDEQAKDALSSLSKKLEMIALEVSNRGWKHLFRLL
ncbi:hypothetical protein U9M48_005027 [Paspalum notatum var. saurae]|uniref:Uncharacterized protein n=1 Tax=Paspalum notatum var. saurae TaxID=547442 RepID=A0AAQ3PR98_PASNO